MSHDDLLRLIRMQGCHLRRSSERHDVYVNPATGRKATIPRDAEMCDELASLIQEYLAEDAKR